jgi:hypothetical protein
MTIIDHRGGESSGESDQARWWQLTRSAREHDVDRDAMRSTPVYSYSIQKGRTVRRAPASLKLLNGQLLRMIRHCGSAVDITPPFCLRSTQSISITAVPDRTAASRRPLYSEALGHVLPN